MVFDLRGILFFIFFILFFLGAFELGDLIYKIAYKRYLKKIRFSRLFSTVLLIYLLYGVFVTLSFSFLYAVFDEVLFGIAHYDNGQYFDFNANIGMFMIYLAILMFQGQLFYFKHWKESQYHAEKLRKENIESKYEALKNQIDPHFFFNSLSVLTSLVYRNQDMSADYITQLSNVYRYTMDQKEKYLVTLEEELEFLDSYIFLIKIRHEENIIFSFDLKEETKKNKYIIPIALQMLVENAIKHNQCSSEEPLKIDIYEESDFIVVRNILNKRKLIEGTSKIGLENIKKRYDLLCGKEIIIEELDHYFIAKLPKLKKQDCENINI